MTLPTPQPDSAGAKAKIPEDLRPEYEAAKRGLKIRERPDGYESQWARNSSIVAYIERIAALEAEIARLQKKHKKAPVQGFSAGIPWSMHLRAYDAYCKKYSPQPALIEGWCRGGFSTGELDMFIPGWRAELDENAALRARNKMLREALENLFALVQGEAPSLLEDDHHYVLVCAALAATESEEPK